MAIGNFIFDSRRCDVGLCLENSYGPVFYYSKFPEKIPPIWNLLREDVTKKMHKLRTFWQNLVSQPKFYRFLSFKEASVKAQIDMSVTSRVLKGFQEYSRVL